MRCSHQPRHSPPEHYHRPTILRGLSNFPTSIYTWQATLARQCSDCQANAIEEAQGAICGMGGVGNLDGLELGNEPDLTWGKIALLAICQQITLASGKRWRLL